MYGRGNYGQGLQRPMLPYQQGHPSATHFRPQNAPPIIQQGGPSPPSGPPYLHPHPAPPNLLHQAPPLSTSNNSQPYLHPPPPPLPFLGAQQSFVSGHQNPHPQPPPPPPSSMGSRAPPPPPPFMHLPPPPPPPPIASQPPPPPPSSPPRVPPPPSYSSQTPPGHGPVPEQVLVSETSVNVTTHSQKSGDAPISDEERSLKQNLLAGLPAPPPKPTDENVVRNIEVLCQFISKNGPEFEEMARKNESGNPNFNFLVGGDPGSEAAIAHEYFLWMKKKCIVENDSRKDQGQKDLSQRDVEPSSGPNELPNVGTAHSPVDSDVDMEDDITQSDKEHGAHTSIEDVEPNAVVPSVANEIHTQENANELPDLKDDNIQADAESNPENPAGQPSKLLNPFTLIQNYASDDSSDDVEKSHENVKDMVALSSHDGTDNFNKEFDIGLGQSVTACLESELAKDQNDLQEIPGDLQEASNNASQGKYEIGDDLDGKIEGINTNTATHKDGEKEDKKNTPSSAVKVDEFGRLVKKSGSDSEADESHHLKRRGRRERSRSRSRSRSPSDRRRRRSPRRSPRRRKERRSRSRSFSPRRRRSRSRSRSPYRRSKVEIPTCFDFLKGRCYRGASCRYMHHDPIKDENPRRYNNKQHYEADKHDSRNLVSQKREDRSIKEAIDDSTFPSVSHQNVEKLAIHFGVEDQAIGASHEPISKEQLSSEQVLNHSHAEGSTGTYHKDDGHDDDDILKKGGSSKIDSSSIQTSIVPPPSGISANEPITDNILNESSAPKSNFSPQVSHLPLPPPPPPLPSNAHYNYIAPSGSLPSQSVPIQSGPMYQASLPSQISHYHVPPNPAWGGPLPQGPPHLVGPSIPGNPLQIQHGNFPLRNDFPSQPHAGGFSHQTYQFPSGNIQAQPFGHPSIARDDRFPQFPTQSIVPPSSSSVPGVAPNILDRADSSSLFDIGGTRITTHYNPYASTFDQPLSTKFSSIAFSQGREAADASNSSKAGGQIVLKSGKDDYDPLFDSIDPKHAQKQDHAADNSDIISKQKMVVSPGNDEFGETAEAEVGAVENGSPSNPNEDADIAEGDIEIDQVKPEGRSKKSKDSRSMKLFKVAVANFVKDMLKPQWRQGNMSKEVFKTIVKKTVDKVSGAMKNHRLPKSQAKIDHYIDSSRRKLTQLVEGYVSKYMN